MKVLKRKLEDKLKRFLKRRGIIITLDKFKKQKIEKTLIYWIPVFYF